MKKKTKSFRLKSRRNSACIILAGFIAMLLCLGGITSPLQAEQGTSVQVNHEHPEAEVELYQIAHGQPESGYIPHQDFESAPVDFNTTDHTELARAAYQHVQENQIAPHHTVQLDENGQGLVHNLNQGMYLVTSSPYENKGEQYIVNPMIVQTTAGRHHQIFLKPMMMMVRTGEIRVEKLWQDENGEEMTPPVSSITAEVLCNGNLYQRLELNEQNHWSAFCVITDFQADWSVRESSAVEGFECSVTRTDWTFTLINKKKPIPPEDPPKDPDDPKDPPKEDPKEPPAGSDPDTPPDDAHKGPQLDTGVHTEWNLPIWGIVIAFIAMQILQKYRDKIPEIGWKKRK